MDRFVFALETSIYIHSERAQVRMYSELPWMGDFHADNRNQTINAIERMEKNEVVKKCKRKLSVNLNCRNENVLSRYENDEGQTFNLRMKRTKKKCDKTLELVFMTFERTFNC